MLIMTIAEQIFEEVQKLSAEEQHRFLDLLLCRVDDEIPSNVDCPVTQTEVAVDTSSLGSKLAAFGRRMQSSLTNLPPDLAANHDHYLHGLPKQS